MEDTALEKKLNKSWPGSDPRAISSELAKAGFGERALAAALKRGLVYRLRRGPKCGRPIGKN